MNIAFLCNTLSPMHWVNLLSQNGYNTISFVYGDPKKELELIAKLQEFKPDVIHLHWREHRDFTGTINFIKKMRENIKVPLMLQLDYQPRYLIDEDLIFANLGSILVSENILVKEFSRQPGITVPTYYIGAAEWGADGDILFHNGVWIKFSEVYDKLAGNPTLFSRGGFMNYNRETKKLEDYLLKISKAEDRKRLWATCWHDRPEMPMDNKFKIMKILGDSPHNTDYKCRWFNGWEANSLQQMHDYAEAHQVPKEYYEAYEWMGLEYWEKLSECRCSVDNMYWGTCSLGMESAVFKIPLVGNSLSTTAVVLNPKLVTDDIVKQARLVKWLINEPKIARRMGEEAYNNYLEHYSTENKLRRFKEAVKMVGL
jgi:glycosyltransferase involved in cell wall biosynthesis